jgi:phytoene dehydrogenase-like protein
MPSRSRDAIVVGSGPNGLAAAIVLARAGQSVLVMEADNRLGGGTRSAELTLPGFTHDICSAAHPLAMASPFFRSCPLGDYGLQFVQPPVPLAHPMDGGRVAVLCRSLAETATGLGQDARVYQALMAPLVAHAADLLSEILRPLRPPRHPVTLARFGWRARHSAVGLAARFKTDEARALLAGLAAHSILRLGELPTGAVALMFAVTAHAWGWPVIRSGSQQLANAMVRYLESLGGAVTIDQRVDSVKELPPHRVALLDLTPRELLRVAGHAWPSAYRERLERYRYGPGVFKVDWALEDPIPWQAEACRRAGSIHLGGTFEDIVASEDQVHAGKHPEQPFVILVQPSLFDPTRAPAGEHTAWAYCHVPNGSTVDMTDRIEAQVERFAPGFLNRVAGRHVMAPLDLQRYNPNLVGGDINGGAADLRQLFTRPTWMTYRTPNERIYICSSATPPTGGVHGMCGNNAAELALRRTLSRS